jgi:hypothetical protein
MADPYQPLSAPVPAPVVVVSPQFCSPDVVPLTVTKKVASLSGGDFTVTDDNGAVVLQVKGSFFHRPQPPRAPRRRRTARPLHAREGKLSHRSAMHPFLSLFRFWACDLTNSEGVERCSQKESSKHPRN